MKLMQSDSAVVQSTTAVAIALAAGMAAALVVAAGGTRLAVVVLGTAAILFVLAHSPNPRRLLLWMLIVSVPMALSKHFDEIVFKGGGEQSFRIELYDVFWFPLLLCQLRDGIKGRVKGLRIPWVTWLWVLLMVMGVIDVIEGPWRTSGAHELLRMFKVILFFIVLVNELRSPRQVLQCAIPLAVGVLIQAGVAFLQFFKGGLLGLEVLGETTDKTIQNLAYTSVEGSLTFRPSGLLLHANILGIYLAVSLPLLIAGLLVEKSMVKRAFLVIATGAGVGALVLSQSRSAWVGFALGYALLLALLVSHRQLAERAKRIAALSGVTMLAVLVPFSGRIVTRLFNSKDDATIGREVFLGDFHRLIRDHWLWGTGLNSYSYEVVPYLSFSVKVYHNWVPPVHNIYYLWWGETGIVGLALNLALWGGTLLVGIMNLRVKDPVMFSLNAAGLAANLAFIFDGFLSFSLRVNEPQRFFFFVAAVFFAVHYWRRRYEGAAVPGT